MILVDKNVNNFVLVDGSSYLYRAYYALPHLKNLNGEHTGAIFGVSSMIFKLLKTYNPRHLCVVFDARGKNYRHRIYKDYKANRSAMPSELSEQVKPIMSFIENLGIKILQVPDVEADDVIATLATINYDKNVNILISSGDKDLAQLVSNRVTLVNSMDDKILDIQGVKNKFGVSPENIFDYLVLIGDKSDNIPGVDKIGPKTAINLINMYGDLDAILSNIDKLKGKVKENISNSSQTINLAKKLIKLKKDVNVSKNLDDYLIQSRNEELLSEIITKYELKSIAKNFSIEKKISTTQNKKKYKVIKSERDFLNLLDILLEEKIFAFDTETTSLDPFDAELVGVSFSIKEHNAFYIPLGHDADNIDFSMDLFLQNLKKIFNMKDLIIIGQNIKYDINVLHKYEVEFNCKVEDTMLLSYIYNSSGKHDLDTLSEKYLNYKTTTYEDIVGSGVKQKSFAEINVKDAGNYACEDADVTLQLFNYLSKKLNTLDGQQKLYRDIENPLIKVIAQIEQNGVMIDSKSLEKQSIDLNRRIKKIEKNVYKLANKEFNIGSPKQLQEIFYEDLKLPILKKTPTGKPSTNEDVMQELSLSHELPKLILQYRNLMKLKNTYTDKLGGQINQSTQRLHTSYNQTVTITGRLSSSNPNLQNIPVKTQDGKNIRKTFITPKKYQIISADYSQIELRVMAHLSKDKNLSKSFMNNEDIHSATAKEIFAITKNPTEEQRRAAKTINFGLIYGISSYGLSRQLKIDPNSAKEYIAKYFERYNGIKKFMDIVKSETKKNGYTSTLLGRRIYIPNITHSNFQIRSAAERTAINAPIQGTAADILKMAMIDVYKWIKEGNCPVRVIMQVHDELVFEVQKEFVEEAKAEITKLMSGCYQLDVPLIVDVGVGDNWDKAH